MAVVQTDFASGTGIQGGFRIAGDVAEGVVNSVADTVRQGADSLAQRIDDRYDGVVSDVAARVVSGAGSAAERVLDAGGDLLEKGADLVGGGARRSATGSAEARSRPDHCTSL